MRIKSLGDFSFLAAARRLIFALLRSLVLVVVGGMSSILRSVCVSGKDNRR